MVVPFTYHHEVDGIERVDHLRNVDDLSCLDIHSNGVSYDDLMSRLEYAYLHDLDVIMLYSSGKINRVNEAVFLLALEDFKKKIKNDNKKFKVYAIDSTLISQSLGILVNTLVELSQKGKNIDELRNYIIRNRDSFKLDFFTDDVDQLLESKSTISRLFEKSVAKKSVYSVSDGKVINSRKCNSPSARVDVLVNKFMEEADLRYPVSVVSTNNEGLSKYIYRSINSRTYDLEISDASRVTKSIIGDNAVGIAYKKKVK